MFLFKRSSVFLQLIKVIRNISRAFTYCTTRCLAAKYFQKARKAFPRRRIPLDPIAICSLTISANNAKAKQ